VVCQFHEWLSGAGLLHLKLNKVKAKTVFTTHATVFGRAFAGAGSDLASLVEEGLSKRQSLPLDLVYKFGVQAKHLLEKASAEQADVFTTVSDVTAKEAHFVLGKKPEILTPNGLDMKEFPLMEDISDMHIRYRNQIRKFVLDYFVPYYDIDVKDTLFFFISGRHEFHNKGIDLFIDALGKLNKAIKKRKRETKKVIAFIFIPDSSAGRNVEMLKNISRFQRIEDLIDAELPKIKEKIFGLLAKSQMPSEGKVFEEEFLFDLKKLVLKIKASEGSLPPLSPFDIQSGDDIIGAIKENDLLNRRDDAVKVVYYPDYLSSADGLLGLNYYDAIIGCHVGIFPSYYEPWGYTPLETAALGVQSVTSDLSGFGQFIRKKIGNREQSASIVVLNYGGNGYRATVEELAGLLLKIYRMSKKERQDAKIEAKQLSFLADWGFLIENYKKAYQMALGK
jgi:glycogen(starch) synthase